MSPSAKATRRETQQLVRGCLVLGTAQHNRTPIYIRFLQKHNTTISTHTARGVDVVSSDEIRDHSAVALQILGPRLVKNHSNCSIRVWRWAGDSHSGFVRCASIQLCLGPALGNDDHETAEDAVEAVNPWPAPPRVAHCRVGQLTFAFDSGKQRWFRVFGLLVCCVPALAAGRFHRHLGLCVLKPWEGRRAQRLWRSLVHIKSETTRR
ncbi:hypothetical protein BT67DRAFT_309116 [Trichocladium antarcticum]|uniref:Uncharacterized protein n=1 Tax=Trichocladium antarcticum TaxID=1450529 RepID=A0AAN6UJP7_9PEZI|nr:hypothetical protein BT67DRAFT_309116 [Trichocladium antarcticum]